MSSFAELSAGLSRGVSSPLKAALMRATVGILLRYANRNTPEVSGTLKRGNQSNVVASGDYGRVFNQVPYAHYVHGGTKPHVIRPKQPGGVLAFSVGGVMVFTRKVNHPGTKANPFYERAIDQSEGERMFLLGRTGDQILAEVAQ